MVFLGIRTLYGLARQFAIIFVRIVYMLWDQFVLGGIEVFESKKKKRNSSLFAVFTSLGNRDDVRIRASFTIEATLALGVVFLSIALLIQYAYTEHDKVTGTAILEEVLIRVRRDHEKEYSETYFEDMGKQLGNPRLWLGEYEIDISMKNGAASGKAASGDWKKEMEIGIFQPSTYLRRKEFLEELLKGGDEKDDRRYRIQEGNEPELYGDSFGNGQG